MHTPVPGSPILAQECIEDYLTFDCGGRDEEFFALRVRGESMLNAGLVGDLLRVLLLIVLPLTVAAAFMECYVTPVIMGFFG